MTPESSQPKGLPLAPFHHKLGATFDQMAGTQTVERYGDPRREAQALAEAAGLLDRSHIDGLELLGRDRQRFLNGLVTCDVQSLEPGQGAYGFFTSPRGKILADVEILALPESLWLELPPGKGAFVADHLKKYIIADKVELRALDRLPITVLGSGAEALLATQTELPAGSRNHGLAQVAGVEVRLARLSRAGLPSFDLWVPPSEAQALVEALLALPGIQAVGRLAYEQMRIEAGVPAFGQDFGEAHFPQESGLETLAVSYTKGCYLGQEIVARIHYRGKANHRLSRLVFQAEALPPTGTRLLLEGQEIGKVGSAVIPLAGGCPVGLAVVDRKGGEPGTVLEVEGFATAKLAASESE